MQRWTWILPTLLLIESLTLSGASVTELCARADSLALAGNAPAAKQTITDAYRLDARNYPVLWRLAKCLTDNGDRMNDEGQRAAEYRKARAFADTAIFVNRQGMQGYLRRSIASGKLAMTRGIFAAADLVKSAHRDARKAIKLNNAGNYTLAVAHYVVGRIHLELAARHYLLRLPLGLGFGNSDAARRHCAIAVRLVPKNILFRLDYARSLLEDDREAEAETELRHIRGMEAEFAGDDKLKRRAAGLLRKLTSHQ